MTYPVRFSHASKLTCSALFCFTLLACSTNNDESELDESSSALRVCAVQSDVRGIDVSTYQGVIDWPAAFAGGVRFASMRLANNRTIDTSFARNWAGAKSAGVLRGAYQFFNPHADAAAQANLLVATLRANGFGPGDLPPEIDVEWPASSSSPLPAPAAYAASIRVWVQIVQRELGVDPILYTGGPYWDAHVKSDAFKSLPLWHAEYPNYFGPGNSRNTIYPMSISPAPRGACPQYLSTSLPQWTFWQFAGDNGRAPGVNGPVDVNIFNGSLNDLRKLARDPSLSVADAGVSDAGADSAEEAQQAPGAEGRDAARQSETRDASNLGPATEPPGEDGVAAGAGAGCSTGEMQRTSAVPWLALLSGVAALVLRSRRPNTA
jgi:lysozyme